MLFPDVTTLIRLSKKIHSAVTYNNLNCTFDLRYVFLQNVIPKEDRHQYHFHYLLKCQNCFITDLSMADQFILFVESYYFTVTFMNYGLFLDRNTINIFNE